MAKKRKTRQQKIILQLKRQLASQRAIPAPISSKFKARQEAKSNEPKVKIYEASQNKKLDSSIYFYDPRLVKKDLFKTTILALIALSFEFVLYLKLR